MYLGFATTRPTNNITMKKHLLLFTIVLALFTNSSFAQTTTPAAASTATIIGPPTYIDAFFKAYEKHGTARAVNNLFKSNKLVDTANLVGLVSKMDSARAAIGLYMGKELIMQRKASNSLVLYSYLVKHEFDPLRLTFIFYKAKNEWVIYRFYFDNQVIEELQSSSVITSKP